MTTLPPAPPAPKRRGLANVFKPVLMATALAGCGLLGYGVVQFDATPVQAKHDDRSNPWRGLPGCIELANDGTGDRHFLHHSKATQLACGDAAYRPLTTQHIGQPEGILAALRRLTQEPASALPVDKNGNIAPQINKAAGRQIAQGQHLAITLGLSRQIAAQALADCMTAQPGSPACPATDSSRPAPSWPGHYEGAAAQTLALVDVDIASGEIRALASAHSPCFARYWSKNPTAQDDNAPPCPVMPALKNAQPWRLDNHALSTTWMMGSIDKPWLMLTLLRGPLGESLQHGAGKAWLLHTLKTSDSVALFNRLLCADKGFPANCNRIQGLARAADDLGQNGVPIALIPGESGQSPSLQVPNGRLMQHPVGQTSTRQWHWLAETMPNTALLKRCAANSFSACDGEDVANLLSELWGQGNSQATPFSAAAMVARLGAAANGQPAGTPHLVTHIGGKAVAPAAQPLNIARPHAALITQGMTLTHQGGGTAHAACAAVLGAGVCKNIHYVAGKTGTPAFAHDRLTLQERTLLCGKSEELLQSTRASGKQPPSQALAASARCHMQPFKWYVALVKDSTAPNAPYTRAIAVAAQRNWRLDGHVDSAGDHGINVAAEMAWRYIARTHAAFGTSTSRFPDHAVDIQN